MTQQTTIRQQFDRHANAYGRNLLTRWIGRSELIAIQRFIPPAAEPGVTPALDFGCGTGRLTAVLLDLGYRVTGYDLSPEMVAKAAARLGSHPHLTLTTDSRAIQGSWPLITALGILDYYADPLPLWQEWQELLALDGRLIVTSPNARSPLVWLYTLVSRFTCQAQGHSMEDLRETAVSARLALTDIRPVFPHHAQLGHTLVMRLQHAAH